MLTDILKPLDHSIYAILLCKTESFRWGLCVRIADELSIGKKKAANEFIFNVFSSGIPLLPIDKTQADERWPRFTEWNKLFLSIFEGLFSRISQHNIIALLFYCTNFSKQLWRSHKKIFIERRNVFKIETVLKVEESFIYIAISLMNKTKLCWVMHLEVVLTN